MGREQPHCIWGCQPQVHHCHTCGKARISGTTVIGRALASTAACFPVGATTAGILESCVLPLQLQVASLGLRDHLPWPKGWHHGYHLCCFISSASSVVPVHSPLDGQICGTLWHPGGSTNTEEAQQRGSFVVLWMFYYKYIERERQSIICYHDADVTPRANY